MQNDGNRCEKKVGKEESERRLKRMKSEVILPLCSTERVDFVVASLVLMGGLPLPWI